MVSKEKREEFIEALKEEIRDSGLTVARFARELDCSERTIYKWLAGETFPNRNSVVGTKILDRLDM